MEDGNDDLCQSRNTRSRTLTLKHERVTHWMEHIFPHDKDCKIISNSVWLVSPWVTDTGQLGRVHLFWTTIERHDHYLVLSKIH